MDDEKLILMVQARECLYNKFLPTYKLAEKKKRVWQEIAQEMQFPEEICMKRWSCLRDRYAKEKRSEILPSGGGSKLKPRWALMEAMEFISPHIVPRVTHRSCSILESDSTILESECEFASCSQNDEPSPLPNKRKRKTNNVDADNSFLEAVEAFKSICKQNERDDEKDPLVGFAKMIVAMIATMPSKKQNEVILKVTTLVTEISLRLED